MASRRYGQYCGLARALEIVGERWSLLLVRDLLLGPKRYTDLRRGLPRIPTNILSTRLKELERDGVIARRVLPRPAASAVYELTDYGRELEDVVLRLGQWGAKSLGQRHPDDTVTAELLVLSLRAMFLPERARGLRVTYQVSLGDLVVHAVINDGALTSGEGPASDPDLVIHTRIPLTHLFSGAVSPEDALADGSVSLAGDPVLLSTFVRVFHLAPACYELPGSRADGDNGPR